MTTLLLIRHGQSANNALPEPKRVCDPGLTELGKAQALATAEHLKAASIDALYCSAFLRALETTRPIAELRNQSVGIRADIFEKGGCYSGYDEVGKRGEAGMGASELSAKYPGWYVDPQIPEAGWWGKDYESLEQARERALGVEQWIASDIVPQGGCHALVIHADFKSILLTTLMRHTQADFRVAELLWNTGITQLELHEGSNWELVKLNTVEHLESELQSY